MTLDEFLYNHDLPLTAYLINQHIQFNGLGETKKESVEKVTNPREFFI